MYWFHRIKRKTTQCVGFTEQKQRNLLVSQDKSKAMYWFQRKNKNNAMYWFHRTKTTQCIGFTEQKQRQHNIFVSKN